MISFSRRELTRAWRNADTASVAASRSNSHRLLLFYAVECGLKAAYLKNRNKDASENEFSEMQHNLNRLMVALCIGKDLLLPESLQLSSLRDSNRLDVSRNCGCGDLNQVWRYGGKLKQPDDKTLEEKLEAINAWLKKELQ
ncbi:hypothetical protein RP726_08500 [Candidatus Methylospira mobilis]|uniref:hypothetical protein n=1 Tax=Candidatus Methylospira mobilis TaxID=1808979 RepID=UPI0028E25473|nr:hypothetical protein [Candidatus Methylospira mobilis]WNV06430.1 hypothetical protein RP726_08500 [Candidatus Methylospira mobilis]